MKTTRPKSYQLGAAHERQAIKAYIKRLRSADPKIKEWLQEVVGWIDERTERANAKPGGLQGRKRKANSTAGKIKSAFGCKVPSV